MKLKQVCLADLFGLPPSVHSLSRTYASWTSMLHFYARPRNSELFPFRESLFSGSAGCSPAQCSDETAEAADARHSEGKPEVGSKARCSKVVCCCSCNCLDCAACHSMKSQCRKVCNNAIWVTICWNRLFAEIDLPVEDSCSLGAALQHIAKSKESLLRDQRRMACVAWSLIAARVPEVARNLESIIKCWLLTMTAGEDEVDVEAWAGFSVAAKSQPEILVSHANELKRTIQSVRRSLADV